jgi:hypothetical protein
MKVKSALAIAGLTSSAIAIFPDCVNGIVSIALQFKKVQITYVIPAGKQHDM